MTAVDFDAVYRAHPDPWGVGSRWYERRKRAVLLASLTSVRYHHGWDLACGTGVLARDLAARCAHVTASDGSSVAVRRAQSPEMSAPESKIRYRVLQLPLAGPEPTLCGVDLVVVSEVLYYLSEPQRQTLVAQIVAIAGARAEIVLVHWSPRPDDGEVSGRIANREAVEFLTAENWSHAVRHDDREFQLDVLCRA
jgi:SAM-dependent methyltransferase